MNSKARCLQRECGDQTRHPCAKNNGRMQEPSINTRNKGLSVQVGANIQVHYSTGFSLMRGDNLYGTWLKQRVLCQATPGGAFGPQGNTQPASRLRATALHNTTPQLYWHTPTAADDSKTLGQGQPPTRTRTLHSRRAS